MALRSPSSAPPLGPRDSQPPGSPPPTSQILPLTPCRCRCQCAMALRSPGSTTPRRDRDSPSQSQGGSGNGARADLFANLEREGVEIDGRIASIIDDEIARIKAEAASKYIINGPMRTVWKVLLTISGVGFGFCMGAESYERALLEAVCRKILFG